MLNPRQGDWMQTFTGRQFWPLDPQPEDIDIEDIAHSLAMQTRYNGHCTRFYSVAEHSYFVSRYCNDDLESAKAALLHDGSEAYLCDIPRPLKPFITNYHELEDRVSRAIADKFGLWYPWPEMVKRADNALLATEQAQVMAPPPARWVLPEQPFDVELQCYSPEQAKMLFLNRFYELFGG